MIISSEKFIPHSLQNLTEAGVFASPLPEVFYDKICREYAEVDDVAVNRIVYESDGLKVTGISAAPAKLSHKPHPVFIYNRGGNREFGRLTVLAVMRTLVPFARAGYMVYASNYRGNDGGEGMEEFGGADVDDVLNLMEAAKENPAWDGKNIFMQGHSRGGMMTYMSLRRNKSITAAISIAGVSDLGQSGVERPGMEENVYSKLIRVQESGREQAYKDRSAICWADEIDTPLLLLHGDADERVDVSHSIKLAGKLEEYGKEHELVVYKGGNHALLRFWDDVTAKSLGWFTKYTSPSTLQGEGWGEGKGNI